LNFLHEIKCVYIRINNILALQNIKCKNFIYIINYILFFLNFLFKTTIRTELHS